jgi:hypothetical protein
MAAMKKFSMLISILVGFATASLQAGEPVAYKQVAQPPPELYGTGFYGAIITNSFVAPTPIQY